LAAQPLVYEEYWQNPVAPFNWPQPAVITADDTHNAFVEVFQADEDLWINPAAPVPASNYLRLPFLDPEEIPVGSFPASSPVLDDGGLWAPQIPPADPDLNVLFWLDDGSWVPALEPDEDFLPSQALPAPYNWPQPQQPFAQPDDDFQVPDFVAAEDPIWLQLVPPVQAQNKWPQQAQFEQFESTNLVAFTTEEHGWPLPVPLPSSLALLQQWPFEQNEPAGSLHGAIFEETTWQNPTAPIADSLRPLQQWPFEQNEPAGNLHNTADEDFWHNDVQPIWGYPVPALYFGIINGSFDEVIFSQPTTAIDDEFWFPQIGPLIFPIPASNLLLYPYQPDPEEIPAGSLVPFVPPPPVPCVMPSGFDKDTTISTFSNFKNGPVLALFCRICSSGKPLLVRGDYAIWCQDCCAFVSKQDTFMGTVRAPGQFRGRF
jgi:hypothetical protein